MTAAMMVYGCKRVCVFVGVYVCVLWVREAAILAVGTVCDGCYDGVWV